jgi:transcriptional regulator with PAS, ATPase and Fis domain
MQVTPERVLYYRNPRASTYEDVREGILDIVKRNYRTGETAFETAHRLLVNEALDRCDGWQSGAAELLRVSRRTMNYMCGGLRLRPKDKKRA